MKPTFENLIKNNITIVPRTESQLTEKQIFWSVSAANSLGINTYYVDPATDEVIEAPISVALSKIGQQGDNSSKKFYKLHASASYQRDALDLQIYTYHLDSSSECAATDYEWKFELPTYETSTVYGGGNVEGGQDGNNRVFKLTQKILSPDGLFFAINGVEISDYEVKTAAIEGEKWVYEVVIGDKTAAPVKEDNLYCDGVKLQVDGVDPSSATFERFSRSASESRKKSVMYKEEILLKASANIDAIDPKIADLQSDLASAQESLATAEGARKDADKALEIAENPTAMEQHYNTIIMLGGEILQLRKDILVAERDLESCQEAKVSDTMTKEKVQAESAKFDEQVESFQDAMKKVQDEIANFFPKDDSEDGPEEPELA